MTDMRPIANNKLRSLVAKNAAFAEPMECLSVSKLPEGKQWVWEIKLDGYRALAVKSSSDVMLLSRRNKLLNTKFPYIVESLADLADGTVVDGELVGLDNSGRPDFSLLQNFQAEASRIHYYIFDLLCCKNRDLTRLPLLERRALLKSLVTVRDKRIRISDYVEAGATALLAAVREQQLEGIVGKRKDSLYEPGKRSGAWIKYRINRGQEFVIGGYFPGLHGFDSLIVGYYDGSARNPKLGRHDQDSGFIPKFPVKFDLPDFTIGIPLVARDFVPASGPELVQYLFLIRNGALGAIV